MRIYMQMPATEDKAPRYYQLLLQPDLLGGWSVVREWGTQGAAGRVKKEFFASQDDALEAIEKAREAQIQRGYRVVFMEGMRPGSA